MQTSLRHLKSGYTSLENTEIDEILKELYGKNHERNTILYCEDDNVLRELMTELLSLICPNKELLVVESADMAITILKNNIDFRKKIAFVVSDFDMPPGKTTGGDLAMYFREKLNDHKTPFLLNSGNTSINENMYEGVIDGFLEKPSRMSEIAPSIIKTIKKRLLSLVN